MGAELFGLAYLPYYAAACFVAFWVSGRSAIYSGQRRPVRGAKPPQRKAR
jgi:hypothetical protein